MPDVTITSFIATESKYVTPIAEPLWGNTKGPIVKIETNGRTPIDRETPTDPSPPPTRSHAAECRDGGSSIASAMVAWIAAMLLLIAEAVAILAVAMPARSSAVPVRPVSAHESVETLPGPDKAPPRAMWRTDVTFAAPAPSYGV